MARLDTSAIFMFWKACNASNGMIIFKKKKWEAIVIFKIIILNCMQK